MAKERENKSVELMRLLELLCGKPRRWKVTEMADALELNKRSIYRYLEDLTRFLPLTDDGKGNYWVEGKALLANLNFNYRELTTIMLSLNSVTDRYLRQQMESIVDKIKGTLGETRERHVKELSERIATNDHEAPDATHVLEVVSEAITHHRRLTVDYHSRERVEPVQRRLDPIGMWHHAGAWYFQAFDHLTNTLRRFRISRVKSVAPTEEHFAPRDFSPEEAIYQPWDPPESSSPTRVVIEIDAELTRWLRENPVHTTQQLEPAGEGSRLTLVVGNPAKMVSWVAGLRRARVLEPESLRTAVVEHARHVLEAHGA